MKFLVVDPVRANREWMARVLNAAGHSAIPLQDGQQGLQALAVGRYDCVVPERSMAVVDGLEMLRRMRAGGDATPVVVSSSELSDASKRACEALGVAAFLVQPLAAEQLLDQLALAATALAQ